MRDFLMQSADPSDSIEPFFHLRKEARFFLAGIAVRDDAGHYHLWLPEGPKWRRIQPVDLAEADYFSKVAAKPTDVHYVFVDFMLQHCRNQKALKLLECVRNDIHNLGACFRKLELYHEEGARGSPDTRRFVVTEIEYVVGVCRSLYDLHQRIAKELWHTVDLLDKSTKRKELPESFAEMALVGEKARPPEDLRNRYGLGPRWAGFYSGEAEFFAKLRKLRNDIEHGGLTPEIIFSTHKGFAVNSDSKPFAHFAVWREKTFLPNKLAPIKPVLAHIVRETFRSMGRFIESIAQEISFEPEIAPGYRVFMCGFYIDRLAHLSDYIDSDPWYPETPLPTPASPLPPTGPSGEPKKP